MGEEGRWRGGPVGEAGGGGGGGAFERRTGGGGGGAERGGGGGGPAGAMIFGLLFGESPEDGPAAGGGVFLGAAGSRSLRRASAEREGPAGTGGGPGVVRGGEAVPEGEGERGEEGPPAEETREGAGRAGPPL